MEKRQKFSAEFKREAIRLMQTSCKPTATIARELSVLRNRLYKCAQDAKKKGDQAFRGSGRPKASQNELAALKRELARVKEENEILKGIKGSGSFLRFKERSLTLCLFGFESAGRSVLEIKGHGRSVDGMRSVGISARMLSGYKSR
jgi:transposase